jgi:hypothetical protein
MQLKRILSHTLAVSLLCIPQAFACDRLWLAASGELWLTNDQGARLLASDAGGILHPRWSPSRERIAYAHEFRSEVVVVTDEGKEVTKLSIPAASEVNAALAVGWRGDHRVFLEGHVNPSTSKYLEWDLESGRLVDERVGSWFAVSPDGRLVAQRAHSPHGAPAPYDSALLLINDKRIYPAAGDTSYHRFVGPIVWSSDSSRLALLDRADQGPMQVVVLRPGGEVALRAPLAKRQEPRTLFWDGPTAIDIRSDGQVWRLDTSTGRLESLRDHSSERENAQVPRSLRESAGTAAVHLEDIHCRQ